MNFNKFIGAGVALASSTLVLGSTLSAPAQAFVLNAGDVVNFTGAATVTPTSIQFPGTGTVAATSSGGFLGLIGDTVTLSSLNLVGSPTVTDPFILFGSGLKFKANPSTFPVSVTNVGNFTSILASFRGTFYNGATAVGDGIFTANAQRNNGTYSATVEVVPEPFTILGTATALGFGAFLKNKKKKEDQVSA